MKICNMEIYTNLLCFKHSDIVLEVQMKNAQVKEIKLAIILDFRLEAYFSFF
jgi:hypothetical protein